MDKQTRRKKTRENENLFYPFVFSIFSLLEKQTKSIKTNEKYPNVFNNIKRHYFNDELYRGFSITFSQKNTENFIENQNFNYTLIQEGINFTVYSKLKASLQVQMQHLLARLIHGKR
jgi:hypothetical protein